MKKGVVKFTFLGIGIFVLLFLILFIPEGKSWAGTGATFYNCSGCADCSAAIGNASAGATIFLNNSISGAVGNCINFGNKSNVIFDCTNYSNLIQGDGIGTDYGINLVSVNNDTIRNCNTSKFGTGIYSESSNKNTFINITSNNNTYGLFLILSSNNNFTGLIFNSNTYGFLLSSSSNNNNLTNSTFQENSIGDFYTNGANNCNNYVINITGSGGRAIEYYNYSTTIQNKVLSALILCRTDNEIINNVTIQGSDTLNNNFIFIFDSSNVTLSNINSSYNNYGIVALRVSNSFFTNITANSNLNPGVGISFGSNNSLTNITANSNLDKGIQFFGSLSNRIINSMTNNNPQGLCLLEFSLNNTLNNSISNNNKYGLYISNSNGTVVSNLTAKNNSLYGIMLAGSSQNNIITNSFIQLNNGSAFALNSTGTAPRANYFYNNYFNNSVQYSNISTASINFFNITKTAGANIVGGTYLAGNYWAAPNGSGFSQTCAASTDGICDTSYNFDGINYDYLPLTCIESWSCTSWSTCTGTQTRTCSDANLCQTYKYKPAESQACTIADLGGHVAQSGGGGGSSFFSPILNVTPNKPIEITINNPSMDLNSLILNVRKDVSNSSVNITKINSSTYSLITGLPIGKLYQAFEIEPGISNTNIINATINFKINKTWLADNNITFHLRGSRFWLVENDIVGNIILYRNPNGNSTWMPLATNYSYSDNQSHHFYAYSKGFSTFAIFLNKYDCLPNSARCDNNEVQLCLGNSTWLVTEHCQYGCGDRKCAGSFFVSSQFKFLSIVIVIAVVIIGLILIFYKKKKHKTKRKEVRKKKKKVRRRKKK